MLGQKNHQILIVPSVPCFLEALGLGRARPQEQVLVMAMAMAAAILVPTVSSRQPLGACKCVCINAGLVRRISSCCPWLGRLPTSAMDVNQIECFPKKPLDLSSPGDPGGRGPGTSFSHQAAVGLALVLYKLCCFSTFAPRRQDRRAGVIKPHFGIRFLRPRKGPICSSLVLHPPHPLT